MFDDGAFAKAASLYDAVICVSLGSRNAPRSTPELIELAARRGARLCGVLSRKPYISKNARLYGLPLAQVADASGRPSEKESRQRSLIVIGIKSAKGDLADFSMQKKMISEIVHERRIADLNLKAADGTELRYIEVKDVRLPRKHKPVRASAWQTEAVRNSGGFNDILDPESILKELTASYLGGGGCVETNRPHSCGPASMPRRRISRRSRLRISSVAGQRPGGRLF